jgi:peptidoglycan LD-endopeptidase LytH
MFRSKKLFFLLLIPVFVFGFSKTHYYVELKGSVYEIREQIRLHRNIAKLRQMPPDQVLLMPVEGVRASQIADTWGAPRSGNRKHEGQDIFAPKGTPIRSATSGYVIRITDQVLGGNSVYIIGAGGRRYFYTHLDSFATALAEGQEVTPETIIGYVGNTGNAATTPPHLHFGAYGDGGAINPLPLIRDR